MGGLTIEIRDLKVKYGLKTAVECFSLDLNKGENLALLGLNGAGKTSTIRAILGMVQAKVGEIRVLGRKPGDAVTFQNLGYAPEDGVPPEFLSGREYLYFVASLKIHDRRVRDQEVDDLLEWFELDPKARIRTYSKGLVRRLLLAQAFVGRPELLILDEPLNGLDPLLIVKLRTRLDRYRAEGGTVLFSSHILAEVEKSCSRVAIIHGGKQVHTDSVENMVNEYGSVENCFAKKVG